MEILQTLEATPDLQAKESILRSRLLVSNFSNSELELLKSNPVIQRHQSLLHIVENHQQSVGFQVTNAKAQKESFLKKFLMSIGLGV